jgi:hypothetical protein
MSGLPFPKRSALQNLYQVGASRKRSWPLVIVPVLSDRSALKNLRDSFARTADHDFVQAMGDQIDYNT